MKEDMKKKFYLYESHLDGSIYWTDHELSYKQRHCEHCGDTDWLFGIVEKPGDVWRVFADEIDVNGSGGYDVEYVIKIITEIPWPDEEEN